MIWDQLGKEGDPEEKELSRALQAQVMSRKLSKLICYHTSEWGADYSSLETEVIAYFDKCIGEAEADSKPAMEEAKPIKLEALKARVESLGFWNQIQVPVQEDEPDEIPGSPKNEYSQKYPWDIDYSSQSDDEKNKQVLVPFPSSSKVYHFHPIAFVEQMKMMDSKEMGDCFCNRDFDAKELRAIVKRIRDNTFYDGESITSFHQEKLFHIRGGVPESDRTFEKFAEVLNKSFNKYGITNCIHKIHFIANMYIETMYFTATEETGDTHSYDPYRGRGFLHLTHDYHYKQYSDIAGNTDVNSGTNYKKVASDLELAADTAGWYWKKNKLNDLSNTDDILKTTKKINGGTNGYKNRRIAWIKLKEAFSYPHGCVTDASKHETPVYGAGVLEEMREWADQHVQYKQEYGAKFRTATTTDALGRLDCSEFVCRYLNKLGVTDSIKAISTAKMINQTEFRKILGNEDIDHVSGSEKSDFIPQAGDIFVWRKTGGGHTGIVHSVDGDKVIILEAIGHGGSSDESFNNNNGGYEGKNCTRTSVYKKTGGALANHAGWKGYFRPKNYTKKL